MATESVSDHTKEIGGKTVPMYNKEEVDEIVVAQVNIYKISALNLIDYGLKPTFHFNYHGSLTQSTLFLIAGYDTTATTLTNSCFLLARNPEVQEKLYNEIVLYQIVLLSF